MSGPTRAELQAQNDALREQAEKAEKIAEAWRDHKLSDPEAEAISGCVKALSALAPEGSSYYQRSTSTGSAPRAVRYLADRFGIAGLYTLEQAEVRLFEMNRIRLVPEAERSSDDGFSS